jgi:hypothetical protein
MVNQPSARWLEAVEPAVCLVGLADVVPAVCSVGLADIVPAICSVGLAILSQLSTSERLALNKGPCRTSSGIDCLR